MKKRIGVLLLVFILSVTGNILSASPASNILFNVVQRPQQTSYYCGPAAAQSVLQWSPGTGETNLTVQNLLASELSTVNPGGTGWYQIDGSTLSDYRMRVVLNARKPTGAPSYYPYTFGSLGSRPALTQDGGRWAILYTVGDNSRAIAADGISTATGNAHLPGYPVSSIAHWIVVKGYTNYANSSGDTICIADPAKSPYVSFSPSIAAVYYMSLNKAYNFSSAFGLMQNTVP